MIDSLMHANKAALEDAASSFKADVSSRAVKFSFRNKMRCCVSCRRMRRRLKQVCASSVKDVRCVPSLEMVPCSEDVRGVRLVGRVRLPDENDVGLAVGYVLARWLGNIFSQDFKVFRSFWLRNLG